MRLTADILLRAENYINVCKERELNLRGLKIPAIENIAVLQDQFDILDFSDNELRLLDSFPKMKRLSSIFASNNYISKVGPNIGEYLQSLTVLILTNNKIQDLAEIVNIATLTKLEYLTLLDNPVMMNPNYRNLIIFKIPTLKSLDFQKITLKEREIATKFFKTAPGRSLLKSLSTSQHIEVNGFSHENNGDNELSDDSPQAEISAPTVSVPSQLTLSEEQKKLVREAIQKAKSKDEIDLIEKHLKSGTFFSEFQCLK